MAIYFQALTHQDFLNAEEGSRVVGYIQQGQEECPGAVTLGKEVEDLGNESTEYKRFLQCSLEASSSIKAVQEGRTTSYTDLATIRLYCK